MTQRHHSPKEDRSRDWRRMRDTVWNVASDSSLPSIHPPSKLLNVTKDSINSLGSQTGLPLAHQLHSLQTLSSFLYYLLSEWVFA